MSEAERPGNAKAERPGNANLPIGARAERPGNANLPIGDGEQGAIHENGVPGGGRGWHDRGYLPHFDSAEATQHVTFHLADSLPRDVLERLEAEVRSLPTAQRGLERRKKIESWIDAGHGSCVLRDPAVAAMVQNAFLFFHARRYRLVAWVVMPNHVHVLFRPIKGWTVAKIVASWKKFTARKICDHRRATGNANLPIGARAERPGNANLPIGARAERPGNANLPIGGGEQGAIHENGVPGRPVWHREYWDRFIRDETHFHQALDYIHQNPVKAGLVARAADWRWSSAHPGNANLLIGGPDGATPLVGEAEDANQEIGVPGEEA